MDLFQTLRTMQLLLIEDDEWIRDSLKLFFESEGCHIVTVESAEAGLDVVKQRNFDIIITDYRLPGLSGIDFVERLSADQKGALTLLITAYRSKEVMSKAHSAGVHETIFKPFNSEDIKRSLKRLLKTRNHRRVIQ
jgi:DNA-binding NtrC family response regulator